MFARVSTYDQGSDEIVDGFDAQTDALQQLDGFKGAYFLVDREGGKAMSVTLWESRDALEATSDRAQQMRDDATGRAGAATVSVDTYEVAVQL
jgi:heme-degrading monooxygenase HmoA